MVQSDNEGVLFTLQWRQLDSSLPTKATAMKRKDYGTTHHKGRLQTVLQIYGCEKNRQTATVGYGRHWIGMTALNRSILHLSPSLRSRQ
jgi:hypothetical protein